MNSTEYIEKCKITESAGNVKEQAEYDEKLNARMCSPEGQRMLHAAMGLSTEVGEIVDVIKRLVRYGKPADRVNLIEEVGDVLWYMALIADQYGFTFEESMDVNIAKLRTRFPGKFTEEKALNRDLDAERRELEGRN